MTPRGKAILAIRDPGDAEAVAAALPPGWAMLLGGSGTDVIEASMSLSLAGWVVFVHLDMVHGLTRDAEGLAVLARYGAPQGVISTHPSVVVAGRQLGLATSLRIFLVDSASVRTGILQAQRARPDFIELLPGVLPELIAPVADATGLPVIPGGLITRVEEAERVLAAGATAVSTSSLGVYRALVDGVARAGRGSR